LQRKLESSAQEWSQRNRPTGNEYLLGGTQLQETLAFVQLHRDELSDLAQEYIAASRKSQSRLRLRTSMLIPLALIAGMAAHLLSRLIFPTASQPPAATDIQSPIQTETQPAEGTKETPQASPGLWQRRPKSPTAIPKTDIAPVEDPNESLSSQPAADDYIMVPDGNVMVPGGRIPSPNNPDEMVEIWWMQPKGMTTPVPIPARSKPATQPEPAVVGSP